MSYGAFPIFPLHGNPYKTVLKHNKFLNSRESYAILHFAPNIFLIFSKSIFFHISPTSPKKSIMGKLLDFALKIAHRGNIGSHRGKRKLICLSKK